MPKQQTFRFLTKWIHAFSCSIINKCVTYICNDIPAVSIQCKNILQSTCHQNTIQHVPHLSYYHQPDVLVPQYSLCSLQSTYCKMENYLLHLSCLSPTIAMDTSLYLQCLPTQGLIPWRTFSRRKGMGAMVGSLMGLKWSSLHILRALFYTN